MDFNTALAQSKENEFRENLLNDIEQLKRDMALILALLQKAPKAKE